MTCLEKVPDKTDIKSAEARWRFGVSLVNAGLFQGDPVASQIDGAEDDDPWRDSVGIRKEVASSGCRKYSEGSGGYAEHGVDAPEEFDAQEEFDAPQKFGAVVEFVRHPVDEVVSETSTRVDGHLVQMHDKIGRLCSMCQGLYRADAADAAACQESCALRLCRPCQDAMLDGMPWVLGEEGIVEVVTRFEVTPTGDICPASQTSTRSQVTSRNHWSVKLPETWAECLEQGVRTEPILMPGGKWVFPLAQDVKKFMEVPCPFECQFCGKGCCLVGQQHECVCTRCLFVETRRALRRDEGNEVLDL